MSRIWDCVVVSCPTCGAVENQRCKPIPQRYRANSKRLEVDSPHVCRIMKHSREKNAKAHAENERFHNQKGVWS